MTASRPSSNRGRQARTGFTLIELPFDRLRVVRQRERSAFTLIELLAVIAVIMVLLTLLVPSLRRARELMRRAQCNNNARCLAQAALAYNEKYGCLSPIGNPARDIVWYQKEFLGQFFGEDVPYGPTVDGVGAPPMKSVLRCPSEAAWSGIDPLRSWIAYNSQMSYEFQPPGTEYRCFWRGPRLEEIFNPPDAFLLFGDGRGSGIYYVGDHAYNTAPYPPDPDRPGAMDARHEGGVNACFLDGHAAFMGDPTEAHFHHKIYLMTRSPNK
ncbi:MAG TPA: prepilin-type N-terminal cleavage/methylation domain-containing protein [Phycisphaerae bacterium]|nr:prepilin-type N-terminal cleavage/methylation domain-containing protein [Phycisphaerae bacterium]